MNDASMNFTINVAAQLIVKIFVPSLKVRKFQSHIGLIEKETEEKETRRKSSWNSEEVLLAIYFVTTKKILDKTTNKNINR